MSRLEYKWIIYGTNITRKSLTPLLKNEINAALINFETSSTRLSIIQVSNEFFQNQNSYFKMLVMLQIV